MPFQQSGEAAQRKLLATHHEALVQMKAVAARTAHPSGRVRPPTARHNGSVRPPPAESGEPRSAPVAESGPPPETTRQSHEAFVENQETTGHTHMLELMRGIVGGGQGVM